MAWLAVFLSWQPALAADDLRLAAATTSSKKSSAATKAKAGAEAARWNAVQKERAPSHIVRLARSFKRDFPKSERLKEASELESNATRVAHIQRDAGLTSEFFETTRGDRVFEANLLGAAHGDAEAAYSVATAFREGKSGPPANTRRYEQWLRVASELGHARASWEFAQVVNRSGLVAEAAHYEKRALVLGYQPPPRLSNRDY
jgi:TPR repeat protein